MEAYELILRVYGDAPMVRAVEVPAEFTFRDLGAVILASFGIPSDVRTAFVIPGCIVTDNMEHDFEVCRNDVFRRADTPLKELIDYRFTFLCGRNRVWEVDVSCWETDDDYEFDCALLHCAEGFHVKRAFRDEGDFTELVYSCIHDDEPGHAEALAEAERLGLLEYDTASIQEDLNLIFAGTVPDGAPLRDVPMRVRVMPMDSPGRDPVVLDLPADADFRNLEGMILDSFDLFPQFMSTFIIPGALTIVNRDGKGEIFTYSREPMDTRVSCARGYEMAYALGDPASHFSIEFVDASNPLSRKTP
ncbi:MAG: hypothetical protein Q4Q58_06635 [Thermoplasmata archaeon]|nr:hypothetical protein [Thermoplasmata archaeon]